MEKILKKNETVFIHLGCFDQPVEGWYNTDITPHIFISRIPLLPLLLTKTRFIGEHRYKQHKAGVFRRVHYLNLTKRLPFKDNSVDAIFSSHVIEHLYIYDTYRLLHEIYRILKPKGWVRFVLPDLDKIISDYDSHKPDLFLRAVFENATHALVKNQHHWMFTAPYLKSILSEVGFKHIEQKEYRETQFY